MIRCSAARLALVSIALALAACGDDGGASGGATAGMITSASAGVLTDATTDASTGALSTGTGTTIMAVEPGTTTGPDPTGTTGTVDPGSSSGTGEPIVCLPGDGMEMAPVESSYIWIPSQDLGDIAKISTLTLAEGGRYRTGPLEGAGENPSRTAVSADGRFVVVNGRHSGRTTMFAADPDDCVDTNGDGVIDTSSGPGDVKPWGEDECMIWSIVHPHGGGVIGGPRGVTWTPGTWNDEACVYEDFKVWLGYRLAAANQAALVRIDGMTGAIEETIKVEGWHGSNYAPYGAALDPDFRPWFTGLRGELIRVNSEVTPATLLRVSPPEEVRAYGMTVDRDGDPWIGGCTGPVSTYDVDAEQWVIIPDTGGCHRGIGAGEKYVWVATSSPCGLVQIDRKTRTLVAKHSPPQCTTALGISVDIEDRVWLVDLAGTAWKLDQDDVQWDQKVTIEGQHYVYSDMTGGQVKSILPQ